MKRALAAFVAGIILGATGVAAAAQNYWTRSGPGYSCQGISSGVACNSGNYQVGVTPDFVYVQHRGSKQTFGCRKRSAFKACIKDG